MIQEFLKSIFGSKGVEVKAASSKSEKGQSYQIDHNIIYAFFRSDPLINACVQVTVDNVCSDGYEIEQDKDSPESDMHAAIIEEFFEENNFMSILRNITANLVVFDDAFVEVIMGRKGFPARLYVLDTKTIKIKTDQHGNIKYFYQDLNGIERARWKPEEILHFKLNAFGDRNYGLSLMEPVLYAAAVKKYAENFTAKYFENQKPRGVWIFPEDMADEKFNKLVDEIIEAKTDPQKDIFVKGGNIDFKPLVRAEDMQFTQLLSYLRSQIVTAMLVPPILLGIPEGSNRANADIQMQAFDRRISAIQRAIEYVINHELIKKKFGYRDVKFRFLRVNKRDDLREVQIARSMAGFATLNEVREMVGLPERPDGDVIWNGQAPAQEQVEKLTEGREYTEGAQESDVNQEDGKDFFKQIGEKMDEGEPAPKENPITEEDENRMINTLKKKLKKIKAQIKKEIKANRQEFKKAVDPNSLVEKVITKEIAQSMEEQLKQLIAAAFTKGFLSTKKEGIKLEYSADPELINFLNNYNFDLVKGLSEDMKNKLRQVIHRAVIDGKPLSAINKEIEDIFGTIENRAEAIGRTEIQRASNYGRLNAYQKAGVKKKRWVSAQDNRVCPICKKMHGQVIQIDRDFQVEYNGKLYRAKAPPLHPNCRCTIVAELDDARA